MKKPTKERKKEKNPPNQPTYQNQKPQKTKNPQNNPKTNKQTEKMQPSNQKKKKTLNRTKHELQLFSLHSKPCDKKKRIKSREHSLACLQPCFAVAGHSGPTRKHLSSNALLAGHRASGHQWILALCSTYLSYGFLWEPLKMVFPHQGGKLPKW